MHTLKNVALTLALLAVPALICAQLGPVIEAGKFSEAGVGDSLPAGWKPLLFKKIEKHTHYSLITDDGTTVVKAVSEASASGLIREVQIIPKNTPSFDGGGR